MAIFPGLWIRDQGFVPFHCAYRIDKLEKIGVICCNILWFLSSFSKDQFKGNSVSCIVPILQCLDYYNILSSN